MRRIAFFGGSFDPPHRGHLAIAKAAADHFALDQILFAPVGQQPFKSAHAATPFAHRYAMTTLATQADARFTPSLLDAPHPFEDRPNYTVETLRRLRSSLKAQSEPARLFTLLGADSWRDIARWHQAPQLLALTDWIVAARPGFSLASALPASVPASPSEPATTEQPLVLHHADGSTTQVWFLLDTQEPISATELRDALECGSGPANCIPPAVQEYIQKTGLYHHREL